MATTAYGSTYVSGTDLVANYPAASLLVAQGIDSAGYFVGRGINAQVASYTTIITDAGKTISMTAAGANTVTIPANASVAYVVGTRINILNLGAGACTPTAGAGVTISGTITALATNGFASLIKTATNTWSYMPPGGFPASGTTTVATQQTSTSTSYTDLATAGPAVTVTTGTKALVIITASLFNSAAVSGTYMSYAVSGATTLAASDTRCLLTRGVTTGQYASEIRASTSVFLTGLTAGSNVFTTKYRVTGNTGYWTDRDINVMDMGS
jgi:hypothetical protein